jgi:hypothetical protein
MVQKNSFNCCKCVDTSHFHETMKGNVPTIIGKAINKLNEYFTFLPDVTLIIIYKFINIKKSYH